MTNGEVGELMEPEAMTVLSGTIWVPGRRSHSKSQQSFQEAPSGFDAPIAGSLMLSFPVSTWPARRCWKPASDSHSRLLQRALCDLKRLGFVSPR
jgi:hypothetical protein